MCSRLYLITALTFASAFSNAASLDYPGDMLSAGQNYVSTSVSASDWYHAADFVEDASISASEDSLRGFSDASNNGYGFTTHLTYMVGLTDDINVGIRYGYVYDKEDAKIDSNSASGIEGELISEGGTDLSVLVKYKIFKGLSLDGEIELPICSSRDVSDLCQSKHPVPQNASQAGSSGGQGNGFYRIKTGLSANWLTEMDTHWLGRVYVSATSADDVFGEKTSSPFVFGASFGGTFYIKPNHNWMAHLTVERKLEYVAYSDQVQTQVNYGKHSSLSFEADYLWDWTSSIQVKPFAVLSVIQRPTQKFAVDGQDRRLEYTPGTQATLGTELSMSF